MEGLTRAPDNADEREEPAEVDDDSKLYFFW
jgi:hypothetical protein